MGLRKPNKLAPPSFKWRVLLPSLGLMWLVIAVLAVYQYQREQWLRATVIKRQLDMVTTNTVAAYSKGLDLVEYLKFVNEFFDNTTYSGLRISLYHYDGSLVHAIGDTIPFKLSNYDTTSGDDAPRQLVNDLDDGRHDQLFYYTSLKSADGKIIVLTAMPQTTRIDSLIERINGIWFVILPLMILASVIVYLLVVHLAKSVKLLAQFADDVASGRRFSQSEDFPHDEFGDISRQLVRLYREKDKAIDELETEHHVALNAIEEKMRFKRELTNNINHELKTPVGIVKGYIDTIMGQPNMDADTMRHFIGRAQTNIDRLVSLIADLSTITRLEDGGQRQVTLEEIDMHDIVYTLADDLKASGVLKGMKFHYRVPLNATVVGNVQLINGILSNLARNALHHSGGTEMGIEMVEMTERYYTFRFYDNGTGVPDESLPKLFDRFYRVDKGRSRKRGDTGLGLAIVYSSIVAMGGAISVKNLSSGGLEFTFTLERWSYEHVKKSQKPVEFGG